ncbi:DUF6789 family protein [Haladaptatus halobius]|uniref:DUF6789 family protein n=1 Tax=Haladaptatus halobius TaxID=2884875 RepID=UPI001D09F4CD|nr:DUF6789 family protein [Haladaptatus halobius]
MTQQRLTHGFGYGIGATILMSLFMLVATVTGASPMPEPIPKAVVATLFGSGLPKPVLLVLVVGLHLGYGGFFGAVLARVTQPVTIWKGLGLGVVLWAVMQLTFLPFLGWGVFGIAITPKIAVATLVLHVVYGGLLGWALDRDAVIQTRESPTAAD